MKCNIPLLFFVSAILVMVQGCSLLKTEPYADVGRYCSIIVDHNSKVHISYWNYTNEDLKYATNDSGAWVKQTIDSKGYVGRDSRISLDKNANLRILYSGEETHATVRKYAIENSGNWEAKKIATIEAGGDLRAFTLDNDNKLQVVSYGDTDKLLRFATDASGSWTRETIVSGDALAVLLTADNNNKTHMVYSRSGIRYATNVSGSWESAIIDTKGVTSPVDIVLDGKQKAHILYTYSRLDSGLKYATNASGSWETETIYSTKEIWGATSPRANSLAIDSKGMAHISYWLLIINPPHSEYLLKYTSNVSGSWETVSLFTPEVSGSYYSSIAVDSTQKAHIAYFAAKEILSFDVLYNGDLKYVTNSSGNWKHEIVDTGL